MARLVKENKTKDKNTLVLDNVYKVNENVLQKGTKLVIKESKQSEDDIVVTKSTKVNDHILVKGDVISLVVEKNHIREDFAEIQEVSHVVAVGRDDNSNKVFLCGFPTEDKAEDFIDFVLSVTDYTVFFAELYGETSFLNAIKYYEAEGVQVAGFEFFPKKSFYRLDFINQVLK